MQEQTKQNKIKSFKNGTLLLGVIVVFLVGFFIGREHVSASLVFGSGNADLSAFWEVWNYIDQKSPDAKNVSSEDRVYGAIKGLVGSLDDPYSNFFDPAESKAFQDEIRGSFGGVGIEISVKDGILTVVAPLKDSPAERAGIRAGDSIIEIDGQATAEMTTDEAIANMRGDKGTTVVVTVYHLNETKPVKISVVRDIIEVPSIETKDLGNGIYKIAIYSFAGNVNADFQKAMTNFTASGDTKLILDVRGNPGGYLDSAIAIASYFLPIGTPVVIEDFGGLAPEQIHRANGSQEVVNLKGLVLLVDGGSASASEILAGALHDEGNAILVGEKTFGKGSVQELIPITDTTSLKLTIAHWLTPLRVSINKEGIEPDYVITPTNADIEADKDPALNKAIEILKLK